MLAARKRKKSLRFPFMVKPLSLIRAIRRSSQASWAVVRKYYIRSVETALAKGWQSASLNLARRHTGAMTRRRRLWPSTVRRLLCDVVRLARLALTPGAQLAAENLFLRKQLALYQERCAKPRRPDPATRVILVLLSRLLEWRSLLTVVQPDTFIRWHRQGWRLFSGVEAVEASSASGRHRGSGQNGGRS